LENKNVTGDISLTKITFKKNIHVAMVSKDNLSTPLNKWHVF
jgi:hypothetical protein